MSAKNKTGEEPRIRIIKRGTKNHTKTQAAGKVCRVLITFHNRDGLLLRQPIDLIFSEVLTSPRIIEFTSHKNISARFYVPKQLTEKEATMLVSVWFEQLNIHDVIRGFIINLVDLKMDGD